MTISRPLRRPRIRTLAILCGLAAPTVAPVLNTQAHAQESVRERIDRMTFPELRFRRLAPREETVHGVPVYFLRDPELPLATFYATFEGGVRHFGRDYFAAATAMAGLLRAGGTATLPPDSVDARIESMALAMSFGQGGGGASSWVNSLSEQVDDAARLWGEMLREPRFDSSQVELWRSAEIERVRRRPEDPASLAFGIFNRIMYGDHPVGWEMTATDLEPDDLTETKLRLVHEAVVCPGNMVMGVAGDVTWGRVRNLLEEILADWPSCSGGLGENPVADIRSEPGVFVLHRKIEQSVVVMAQATTVRQGDNPGYFASRIGNSILGASGLSSRLASEVRTRQGLAYSASSIWTTSSRDDGLAGALTRTKPETTMAAARLLLAAIDSMRAAPPAPREVSHAVDEVVNGFVFNFRTPFQVVARGMAYRRLDLPADWLERYVDGIQDVTPADVREIFRSEVDPARMTILLVGDTTRFDGSASELGAVTVLPERTSPAGVDPVSPSWPRGLRRSRR